MFLTEIDKKTGLVIIDGIDDGVLAIKEFRDLINHKDFGLSCFTAVALVVDYLSPVRNYNEEERHRKAQEEVTGERDKFVWKEDIIQLALKKYEALQFDADLEEKRLHNERRINKMRELKDADKPLTKEEKKEKVVRRPAAVISKELRDINKDIELFDKNTEGKDLYNGSPVKNGYALTRLEQLEQKKNSFYNTIR